MMTTTMPISELKKALSEVVRICAAATDCEACPFNTESLNACPMAEDLCPEGWPVYVWEDEERENT